MENEKESADLTSDDLLAFQTLLVQKSQELHDNNTLHDIKEALERIEAGTYGICLGTGKPIGRKRLAAIPWTKFSIEYAQMMEKEETKMEGQRQGHEKTYMPSDSDDWFPDEPDAHAA